VWSCSRWGESVTYIPGVGLLPEARVKSVAELRHEMTKHFERHFPRFLD
jgi:hypothetical protein